MFREPHPFARFVNILGRGKSFSRALTIEEARESMGMILDGQALPEQIGAYLMLLRFKEEAGSEIAGFAMAARERFQKPAGAPQVDLDWPSYAGKKRQLPWYILAALAIAGSGKRVLMHGADGHTAGRIYSTNALAALGVPFARDAEEAARHLNARNFAYLPLPAINAKLAEMLGLRPILGLRSPVHSLVRALNPFDASASMLGVFHPGYMDIHRDAEVILGHARTVIFRGDGGEAERRPNKPCEIFTVHEAGYDERRWPATIDPRQTPDEDMNLERLAAVWRGEESDAYGEAAVIGTIALALKALGEAHEPAEAEAAAEELWRSRDRAKTVLAA
ncbi:MAG: glycosyl transferase family protein [Rhodoblastus sp.]|nr:glycosyl transferase family protein [Rhodoblastus sp.]